MNNCPNCNKPYQPGDEVCRFCGFILPLSAAVIPAGTILQTRYEIQDLIHSGGMGYVYLATDKRLYDRLCIVKQIKEPIKSEIHRKKLEEEALRMARLNHPNVAIILDHFIDGGYYFLVVERIYGKTLSEVFKEHGSRLTESEVVGWAISICDVVSYLHKEGIVHRDISPDNIMLTGDDTIKFIDFGTLREFKYIAPGGTVGIGKYGYTPPEQWQGKPEPRSDIFSLGATIYYLLTGFLPLSREYTTKQTPQKEDFNPVFPPIRIKNPNVSPQLESVLQKALQLDADDRYASVEEFGHALRNLERVEVKKLPVLSLETEHLDFTNIAPKAIVTKPIILKNIGAGKLTVELTTTQPWLNVSPNKMNLKSGSLIGKVTVNTHRLAPGFHGLGEIDIATNGGLAQVTVDLSVATEARTEAVSKPKSITKRKPIRISQPKATVPLRWIFISLGIVLLVMVGAGGVYLATGRLFTPSATSLTETKSPVPDVTPPVISQVNVAGYTGEDATIIWITDKDTIGQVEYGLTDAYGGLATTDGELTTSHIMQLTGLQPNTTYHFKVRATDNSRNEAESADQTFTNWVADKSFKEYINTKYGFSCKYLNLWTERPDLKTSPSYLAAFGLEKKWAGHGFRGVTIAAINADQPISGAWIIGSLQQMGCLYPQITSPIDETILSDGTKAKIYTTAFTHPTGGNMAAVCLDADKGSSRIRILVFSEDWYLSDNHELYSSDKKFFTQIAHTLSFNSGQTAPLLQPATPLATPASSPTPTPAPIAKPSYQAKTYTNDQYGFSFQYPADWVERPDLMTIPERLAGFGIADSVPGVTISAFKTDAPISSDWILGLFKRPGYERYENPEVILPLKETTTADGTAAIAYKLRFIMGRNPSTIITNYCFDADKDGNRIHLVVFTAETIAPYDEALFSEIAHTLRFKTD